MHERLLILSGQHCTRLVHTLSSYLRTRAHQSRCISSNLCQVSQWTNLSFTFWNEPCSSVWTLDIFAASEDRRECQAADIKRIARIVIDLYSILWRLFTLSQCHACLLCHLHNKDKMYVGCCLWYFGSRIELNQPPAKVTARCKVLDLEEDIHCRSQCQNKMDIFQLAVGKVCSQLC